MMVLGGPQGTDGNDVMKRHGDNENDESLGDARETRGSNSEMREESIRIRTTFQDSPTGEIDCRNTRKYVGKTILSENCAFFEKNRENSRDDYGCQDC